MRSHIVGLTAIFLVSVALAPPLRAEGKSENKSKSMPAAAQVPEGYRIGPGDVLSVVVWREPEASVGDVVVRADGKVSLPLIKELVAAGETPQELEQTITNRLEKFVKDADVTVVPRAINSRRIYIIGAVKKEGPIPLSRPLTVLQALNEVGGLTEYAKKKKIYVLRNENGKAVRFSFDYGLAIRGEHPEQNIALMPDDTIVVPN
jgi:polysaccharide biosynthesis/export protein